MQDIGALSRLAAKPLAKHLGDIGLVVDDQDADAHSLPFYDAVAGLLRPGGSSPRVLAMTGRPLSLRAKRSNLVKTIIKSSLW